MDENGLKGSFTIPPSTPAVVEGSLASSSLQTTNLQNNLIPITGSVTVDFSYLLDFKNKNFTESFHLVGSLLDTDLTDNEGTKIDFDITLETRLDQEGYNYMVESSIGDTQNIATFNDYVFSHILVGGALTVKGVDKNIGDLLRTYLGTYHSGAVIITPSLEPLPEVYTDEVSATPTIESHWFMTGVR